MPQVPSIGRVAVFAPVGSLDMVDIFPGGVSAVVATEAVASNVHMVEIRGQPTDRRMAIFAIITAGNMVRRFAGRCQPIVTGATGTENLGVIDS